MFADVPADLHRPFSDFPADYNDLPDVAFVIPNLDNGMHDGTIEMGDTWLRQHTGPVRAVAQTHNSLFVLTWDEDDANEYNQVIALFAGEMVKPGAYGGLPGGRRRSITTTCSGRWKRCTACPTWGRVRQFRR